MLRQYVADRIHQRDSLVEAALALVISNARNKCDGDDDGEECDAKAAQELLEWRKRLNEESNDLDPTDAVVNGKSQTNGKNASLFIRW